MKELHLKDMTALHDYFFTKENTKWEIYETMINSIETAIANGDNVADMFVIHLDDGQTLYMDAKREEWHQNLETALNYYIENEEYERCTNVKFLIDIEKVYISSTDFQA